MIDMEKIQNKAKDFFATPNIEMLFKAMCDNCGIDDLSKTSGQEDMENLRDSGNFREER